jgi:hypothetical protein
MKFKMLVVCLFVGMAMVSFPKTYTYAAEEGTAITQENVTNNEKTDADKAGAIDISTVGTENTATDITQTAELTQTTETVKQLQTKHRK